ncbi:hypothetical protein ACFQS1_39200 [Paractinoplanes rhizophilus]|uniref:Uncharacterized protein n=1 Tax=Paractinoplanes rhizophilus TaxID=1416877 RepID=A0ABW2I553_9ACTN
MTTTEPGRLAAHVLLDAASIGLDTDETVIVDRAVDHLNQTGCCTALYDDETDTSVVDISNLAGGTLVLHDVLIKQIVELTGKEREVVVAETRELLDAELE